MREITRIFAAYKPNSNEAQTEEGLIKPVLAALGHSYEVQAALKTSDGTKKPDYVFYRVSPRSIRIPPVLTLVVAMLTQQ